MGIGKRYKITTLNIRGIKQFKKRELLETWAHNNNIDILLLQETHVNQTCKETRNQKQIHNLL